MKTLALVIGIDNYKYGTKPINAVNDATAIADTFRTMRYEVILKTDYGQDDVSPILSEFETKIDDFDAAIFYFAGHGFQCEEENYLASVDCQINYPNKYDCRVTSIQLSDILNIFKNAKTKVNIAIIDACRHIIGRGKPNSFGSVNVPQGTIIAFSTSPGDGAKDIGMDGHSVYTGTLLQYMGREFQSIEELFKKVRRSVYNHTGGVQTSWEHTSLIDNFYLNEGQITDFPDLPYHESVIKDKNYLVQDNKVDGLIGNMRIIDWNLQNPAIKEFQNIDPSQISIDQQFIIGRNLLQANGYANEATLFFENLSGNLSKYSTNNNENHVLNGILFEIYFNSMGDFRYTALKKKALPKIYTLRRIDKFKKSFAFINTVLTPYKEHLYYIPDDIITSIDIDVSIDKDNISSDTYNYQIIDRVMYGNKDVTKQMSYMCQAGGNELMVKRKIAELFAAPEELVTIISNRKIESLIFRENLE